MARNAGDGRLNTATARVRLKAQPEPYWRQVQTGQYLGYRCIKGKPGTWIARHYDPGRKPKMKFQALGTADDAGAPASALTFKQAQDAARAWFAAQSKPQLPSPEPSKPGTVKDAADSYLADYKRRSGRATPEVVATINAHILPALGGIELAKLTTARIREWQDALADAPARLRGGKQREIDRKDGNAVRARKSTANRILTVLKAALNRAFEEGKIDTDLAWRRVKPFGKVDESKANYLTNEASLKLIQACPPDLAAIVSGALLTGMRYGELGAMKVADFVPGAGNAKVTRSKTGKARTIVLTDEGVAFFGRQVNGKAADDLVFQRSATVRQATKASLAVKQAAAWGKSDQFRPLRKACERAGIAPIGFHILRHTYASRLAMKGVAIAVIAKQIGDSVAITEKHYAHLAQSHVAETVRRLSGDIGLGGQAEV